MRLVKQLLAVAAVGFVGSRVVAAGPGNPWFTLAAGAATAIAAVVVYAWVVRRTEDRAPTELAWPGATAGTIRGVLIGVAMFAAVIVNIAFLGGYHVHGLGSVSGALALVGFMAAVAVTEELLFRGVLFRIVEERTGTWIALLLTGVVFGLAHLPNPDAGLWGATAIAIEAGFMLAACYVATRSLWLPIGLHFGWNFAAGGIFGTAVSGTGQPDGLLDATTSGPALLTGGAFGPEGSLYAVAAGMILTVVFLWLAHRRGHIVARRRRTAEVGPVATVSA
ncbi:CPBP family intramembrane glutamic endopeptidase [Micromonospora sp. NBC_01813]|uniref:CPBP family intramembrane glutamic endopeptidase n=1 Tax=Micromonospora sp. NBC_01813 TaxID=2975988 RepID=UPI002DD9405F|nr:CPBP family intramembrane glutamic endopeptidase [Micromonospora sp. NBC_01813]WSA09019.1 CPBP family intramembrane metalloprotease [Micromonospora sp. NBC_01813]